MRVTVCTSEEATRRKWEKERRLICTDCGEKDEGIYVYCSSPYETKTEWHSRKRYTAEYHKCKCGAEWKWLDPYPIMSKKNFRANRSKISGILAALCFCIVSAITIAVGDKSIMDVSPILATFTVVALLSCVFLIVYAVYSSIND